jgi:hypothetical protein
VLGRCFEAALAHLSTVVTPPKPSALNLGVALLQPSRGEVLGGTLWRWCELPLCGPQGNLQAQLPTLRGIDASSFSATRYFETLKGGVCDAVSLGRQITKFCLA